MHHVFKLKNNCLNNRDFNIDQNNRVVVLATTGWLKDIPCETHSHNHTRRGVCVWVRFLGGHRYCSCLQIKMPPLSPQVTYENDTTSLTWCNVGSSCSIFMSALREACWERPWLQYSLVVLEKLPHGDVDTSMIYFVWIWVCKWMLNNLPAT